MVEDRPGGEHVALLSYSFSLRYYARYQDVVGQRILLGGEPYTVIPVTATSFDTEQFDQPPAVWVPFQINPLSRDVGGEFCFVTARLKLGIGVENAKARLGRALEEYQRNFVKPTPSITAWYMGR